MLLSRSTRLVAQAPPNESELQEITSRGRELAGYDAAAWHGSDAVMAAKPVEGSVRFYLARNKDGHWTLAFGKFDETETKFLISYEALQQGTTNEYRVQRHDPPEEDGDYYYRAAEARKRALADFRKENAPKRPYNISVFPAPLGDWYVYAIPAQTDSSILPYGGDVRYTVSSDGKTIKDKRQMHKTVLEEQIGKNQAFGFHTHILSDLPEDSDVFYAMTEGATEGDFVATKNFSYQIQSTGAIAYLGRTVEVANRVESGNLPQIPPGARPMFLATLRRLLGESSGGPLEVVSTFLGARCEKHTVWLKFSHILHNIGTEREILYKDPLQNSQARFGTSEVEIKKGTYEKLVFLTPEHEDLGKDESFIVISPGMSYVHEHDYPILGLDLSGKQAVQFVFFTWPVMADKEKESVGKRLEKSGSLFADDLIGDPMPIKLDPTLLKTCTGE